jgi:hypothetical protein
VSTAARAIPEPLIRSVRVTDEAIVATFSDGRVVSMPLHWSYRLEVATPARLERRPRAQPTKRYFSPILFTRSEYRGSPRSGI